MLTLGFNHPCPQSFNDFKISKCFQNVSPLSDFLVTRTCFNHVSELQPSLVNYYLCSSPICCTYLPGDTNGGGTSGEHQGWAHQGSLSGGGKGCSPAPGFSKSALAQASPPVWLFNVKTAALKVFVSLHICSDNQNILTKQRIFNFFFIEKKIY